MRDYHDKTHTVQCFPFPSWHRKQRHALLYLVDVCDNRISTI
ncbi:hypothetical protein BMETH_2523_0 [methanotrophic bacterial endosymbiont of Bathymodiolus sp.]|nr:hypothetical protein BMETH_2523_0 [methanotrophic bacterial endosymbiont of Bathymodiolus sp.]